MTRHLIFFLFLFLFSFSLFFAAMADDADFVQMPLGLDQDVYQVPEDNPITEEKVELGKMLFFDKRLSADGSVSCASCHNPKLGFTDQKVLSDGVGGKKGERNSPTLVNAAFNYFHFWDGRSSSLEEQAEGPMMNPVEMAHSLEGVVDTIKRVSGYKPYFEAAFGDAEISFDRIKKAIAAYERTILSGNSAWDRYVYGKDESALTESAKRGLALFEGKALCSTCHVGFNLTDNLFHNIGVGMHEPNPDLGRYGVTNQEQDKGAFKTPTLRDIQKTFPYMHDGSIETLEEVIDLYDRGGELNPWLDEKIKPLNLTEQEKSDLLSFLKSLEGDEQPAEEPALP